MPKIGSHRRVADLEGPPYPLARPAIDTHAREPCGAELATELLGGDPMPRVRRIRLEGDLAPTVPEELGDRGLSSRFQHARDLSREPRPILNVRDDPEAPHLVDGVCAERCLEAYSELVGSGGGGNA